MMATGSRQGARPAKGVRRATDPVFRRMAERLPDLVWMVDREDRILFANPTACAIAGVAPGALEGRSADSVLHEDDRGVLDRADARATARIVRADGTTVWLDLDICSAGDDMAPVDRIVIGRDVTARRQAEAAQRETAEALDTLLDATMGALFRSRVGNDGSVQIVFVTEGIERLTGYTAHEVVASPHWLAGQIDPAFYEALREHYKRLSAEGTSVVSYRLCRKDRSWIWLTVTSRLVHGGETAEVVGFVTDTTHQHDVDKQVAQSAKLAMLGQMAASMAHELNQPLATIGMIAGNLGNQVERGTADTATLRKKLGWISKQVERAATIINHMRIFGRRQDDRPSPVPVGRAIDGALELLKARLRLSDVTLVRDIGNDLPDVTGHLVLMEQVLVNLIGNAADAIEAHAPPLPDLQRKICLEAFTTKDRVVIRVGDHAGGIPDAVLPQIFEPFFTTKAANIGTGLGLAVSAGIVNEMGGTLTARNRDDGAVFEIRLPYIGVMERVEDRALVLTPA